MRVLTRSRVSVAIVAGALLSAAVPAYAGELVTAELDAVQNEVTVTQGTTATFTVSFTATGNDACGSTATAAVKSAFSLSTTGAVSTGPAFGSAVTFTAPGSGTNCAVTWTGAPTPLTATATVTAASTTPVGSYTVQLSTAADTTQVTNSNTTGGKLGDTSATSLTFKVVAPVVTNHAPSVSAAAADSTGSEGATLTTGGAFADQEGAAGLSITKASGAGTVTPTGSGGWSWSLPTTDDASGSVTVRATDPAGLFVEDTFTWTASNVAPAVSGTPSDANGNEGQTLTAAGSFADVAADPLSITKVGAGTLSDHGDGTWSWSLATTDQASGSVTVTAVDGDGGSTPVTFDYEAVNIDPTVLTAAPDATVDESDAGDGSSSGAFADVAGDSPLSISGTGVTDHGDGSWTGGFDRSDDAAGTVTATASDGDGGSQSDSFDYVVRNVAPYLTTSAADASGVEGQQLTASGAFSDVAADTLTVAKKSGDGTVTDHGNGSWSWALTPADQGNGTVEVEVTDDDGGTFTDSFSWSATNVAPTLVLAAVDATGSEGNTLVTTGSFSDVAADPLTITAEGAGDLTDNGDGTWSWSLPTTDNGSGSVVVTADDGDGGTTTDTFDWSAVNVDPALEQAAADASGNEGSTLVTSGSFSDVAADPLTITAVGAGTLTDNGDGTWSWSLPTTDDGTGTVVVTANDGDGGKTSDTFTWTASNVAPSAATSPGSQTGSEGDTLSTGGTFTDVAADTIAVTKTSGAGVVTDLGGGSWTWSLATTDDASGSVTVTATDDDGGSTPVTFTYSAGNVAPSISVPSTTGAAGTACQTGNLVGLSFSVSDPGSDDAISGTISWGDGSAAQAFTGRTVSTSHSFAPGSYTVTVAAQDDDGGVATPRTFSVTRNYAVGAVQAPLNADGTSVFKYGSTVPVKVRITDCNQAPVPGLAPVITVALASSNPPATGVNEDATSTSAADTTGFLRYDSSAGQYIYNLATKSLRDGDAKYRVTVTQGGAAVSQVFGLRTK